MTTPQRGLLFHFTHIDNLASIAKNGLRCDNNMTGAGIKFTEVGERGIKDRRRQRLVQASQGGTVADYVPFYFAACSPMLNAIHHGRVPTYKGGQAEVIYLVTSVETIVDHKLDFVFTDRNAVLDYAKFSTELKDLDRLIDWSLMKQRFWNNTEKEPDRRERRMAEMLVHRLMPWSAFQRVGVFSEEMKLKASSILSSAGKSTRVEVQKGWYF